MKFFPCNYLNSVTEVLHDYKTNRSDYYQFAISKLAVDCSYNSQSKEEQ